MNAPPTDTSRRGFLRTTAGATATLGLLGAASGPAAAQSSLDDWFAGVGNYDGVVDRRGQSEVTVTVGADANGGAFGFAPAAVHVDPGTTVLWEWSGRGGFHNVVDADGAFESELVGDAGHTFTHTFDEAGTARYACGPHEAMGMKGAVVVGGAGTGEAAGATGATGGAGDILLGVLAGVILTVLAIVPVSEGRKRRARHGGH
jgi:halocyanin-like protein